MNDLFSILYLFTPPFETFWVAVGAIGSIFVAYTAIKPIIQKENISNAIYKNAIQIDITPDGVFRIFNIFD